MPVSRMKMKVWLEQMIESNSISGLVWVDKEQKIFSIPWKHGARHGWEMDKDAHLFKQWAIHTGKYIEGQNAANPKKWKANFRSAMNSLPDIENVKDKSINKGHQAVRVYRMLPLSKDNRKAKGTKQRNKSTSVKSEDMDYSDAPCPVNHSSQPQFDSDSDITSFTQENTVSSTEHQEVTHVNQYEVPDCGASLNVRPDSTNKHFQRFEVSPEHSPAYNDVDEDIFKMCQQMELDSHWTQSSSDGNRFLSNEACTGSYSYSSPGSQWSDTSSDDVEDLPMYATLGDLLPITDDLLNNHNIFHQQADCLL